MWPFVSGWSPCQTPPLCMSLSYTLSLSPLCMSPSLLLSLSHLAPALPPCDALLCMCLSLPLCMSISLSLSMSLSLSLCLSPLAAGLPPCHPPPLCMSLHSSIWLSINFSLSLSLAERRSTRPNGEWRFSTRRHMLGHECPEAVSPERGVVLTDLQSSI